MASYYVETYGADGSTVDADVAEFATMPDAIEEVGRRLGRDVSQSSMWTPDADTRPDDIPSDARPLHAWHESDEELCGGVALWVAD